MKRNYTKSTYSESWINSDNGIVYQVILPKVKKINLEIAKQLVADRKAAMGNLPLDVCVFVTVNNAISVDTQAKRYYKKVEAYDGIRAIAMLVDNYAARLVGNIVFSINKPKVPTSFFNTEQTALQWLQKQSNHQLS